MTVDLECGAAGRVDDELAGAIPPRAPRTVGVVGRDAAEELVAPGFVVDGIGELGALEQDIAEHRANIGARRILRERGLDGTCRGAIAALGGLATLQRLLPCIFGGVGLAGIEGGECLICKDVSFVIRGACGTELDASRRQLVVDRAREIVRNERSLHDVDEDDEDDHGDTDATTQPGAAPNGALRCGDELALERRQVGLFEGERLGELRATPGRVVAMTDALPFAGGFGESFATHLRVGVGIEPIAQRAPATDHDFVRELERRAGFAIVDDEQASLDERVEGRAGAVADGQLGFGAAHARAERGHETEQNACVRARDRRRASARSPNRHDVRAHRRRRPSRRRRSCGITPRSRSRASHSSASANDRSGRPPLPLRGRVDEVADHRVGLERHADVAAAGPVMTSRMRSGGSGRTK